MKPALSVLSATSRPPSNHNVLAAPAARAAGRVSACCREGRLLVGQRHIAADEATLAHVLKKSATSLGSTGWRT